MRMLPMNPVQFSLRKALLFSAALTVAVLTGAATHSRSIAAAAQVAAADPVNAQSDPVLSASEVGQAVQAAAEAIDGSDMSIVVVDRGNETLAAWHRAGATDLEDGLA